MAIPASIGILGNVGVHPRELVAVAQRADAAGLAGVWTIEYEYDSIALDQAIAMSTRSLTTGSCIARNFTRHPLLMAQGAVMIDQFAPGRFVIGLGSGPTRRTGTGKPPQRWGMSAARGVARMSEYVQVIRLALSGEPVHFEGDFYSVDGVRLDPGPVTAEIPIYLAAGGPQMLRLAGRMADGVFVFLADEAATRSAIEQVRAASVQAGRDPGAVTISSLIITCVAEDQDAARTALRRHMVDYYLKLPTYQAMLVAAGFEAEAERLVHALEQGDRDAAADSLSDAVLEAWTICGSPDEARDQLARFAARGIELPILYVFPADGDWRGAYDSTIDWFA
jgi:5,10-methylenetetrahydromethanopterin reductase